MQGNPGDLTPGHQNLKGNASRRYNNNQTKAEKASNKAAQRAEKVKESKYIYLLYQILDENAIYTT